MLDWLYLQSNRENLTVTLLKPDWKLKLPRNRILKIPNLIGIQMTDLDQGRVLFTKLPFQTLLYFILFYFFFRWIQFFLSENQGPGSFSKGTGAYNSGGKQFISSHYSFHFFRCTFLFSIFLNFVIILIFLSSINLLFFSFFFFHFFSAKLMIKIWTVETEVKKATITAEKALHRHMFPQITICRTFQTCQECQECSLDLIPYHLHHRIWI